MTPCRIAPESVFFSLTSECAMRCKVCSMWQLNDSSACLSHEDWLEVTGQLDGFERRVHIEITGGEPFVRMDTLFAIAGKAHDQGNTVGVVTSGYFLTSAVVERLANSGISRLAISLDFPTPEQHDAQRGRRGCFDRATSAIRQLVEMKAKGELVPEVGIDCIIMSQNLNYLEDVATLAADLGVNRLLFQPVQPDFGMDDSLSIRKYRNWLPMNPHYVSHALERLKRLKSKTPIVQSDEEFALIEDFFRNPTRLASGSCKSPEINLVVSTEGDVMHCFGQARTGLSAIGKVPRENLVDLWNGESARRNRLALSGCTLGCGALLCHIRSSVR